MADDVDLEIVPEMDGDTDIDNDGETGAERDAEDEVAEPVAVVKPEPKAKKGRGRPKK